jgi:hypothetical protein
VTHGKRDLTFARLFQAFESVLEEFHFLDIKDFDPDHSIIVLTVLGHIEMGHGSGDCRALSGKTAFDINPSRDIAPGRLKCGF